MKKIHNQLMEKNGVYSTWHNNPLHQSVHFLILIVIAGFTAFHLSSQIGYVGNLQSQAVQATNYNNGHNNLLLDARDLSADVVKNTKAVLNNRIHGAKVDALALANDRFQIALFPDEVVDVVRDMPNQHQGGGSSWVGRINGEKGSTVSISTKGNAISGVVIRNGKTYEINSSGVDNSVIVKQIDLSKLPAHHDPIVPPKTKIAGDTAGGTTPTPTPAPSVASDATPVTVDVMVVYTQAAATKAGGAPNLEAMILNGIALANQGYANSQVNMRVNLAHTEQINYIESGDPTVALGRMRNPSDGYMDNVNVLRDQYNADQVVLIDEDQGYCGISYLMTTPDISFAPNAFSVVNQACISQFTMTHEMGHNQGQQHDHDNAPYQGVSTYSYGYRICNNNTNDFRDIMAYGCPTSAYATRINMFSNPNLTYNGIPEGVADYADVARSLNIVAPIVASFKGTPWSGSVINVPTLSNFSATAVSSTQVSLIWTDTSNYETGFKIERGFAVGSYTPLVTLGANITSYIDTTATSSTTYWYRISAYNDVASSIYNNASVTTPSSTVPPADTTPPSQPQALVSTNVTSSQVSLSWSASSDNVGVTGYRIYRNGSQIAAVTGTSYTNSVSPSTAYTYEVAANDAAGNVSLKSATLSVTTPVAPLSISTSASSITASSATVNWSTNLPTTGYVSYGLTSTSLSNSISTSTSGTMHSTALNGLAKRTTYYYQVTATASDGQTVKTAVQSFKTPNR